MGLDIHTDSWLAPAYGGNNPCLGNVTIAGRGPIGTPRISNPHYVGAKPRTTASLRAEAEEDSAIRAHNARAEAHARDAARDRSPIDRSVGRQDDFIPGPMGRWVS